MAFIVSKAAETTSLSLSDSGKENLNRASEEEDPIITRQLYLRSSSSSTHSPAEAWDKQVVLKRIRHHKCLNKVKATFRALVSNAGQANSVLIDEQKFFNQGDAFSSP